MGTRKVGFLVLAALATAAFACSPLSNAISSRAGTAVSAAAATAGAPSAGQGATESSSGGSGAVSAAGNVAVPTDTVAYEKGKVYAIGQAIKDDKTGVIVQVNDVKFDSSLPGLSAGQTWCLVTVTLGNAGSQPYSASSISSMGIKSSSTGQSYFESLTAIMSQIVTTTTQLDQTIEPGKAFQGILAVIVPDSATGLAYHFTPIEYMSEDLTFQVSLGK